MRNDLLHYKQTKYEVRCCCTPQKLQGWILLSIPPRPGLSIRLNSRDDFNREVPVQAPKRVVVQFTEFDPGNGQGRYIALKAEGVSPEDLRQVPSFIPNDWQVQ